MSAHACARACVCSVMLGVHCTLMSFKKITIASSPNMFVTVHECNRALECATVQV